MAVLLLALAVSAGPAVRAQNVLSEYDLKAVYLFNFVKYTEWPSDALPGPITICVAGTNPFGEALDETIRGEQVDGRPIEARTIRRPEAGCHVLFVPQGATAAPFLAAARAMPTLTVGETGDFLEQGGIIQFVLEDGHVRFQIDPGAAKRVALRISSHLLNLSRDSARG